MTHKELRPGNWVWCKIDNCPIQLKQSDIDAYKVDKSIFEPICLYPVLKKRLGIKWAAYNYLHQFQNAYFGIHKKDFRNNDLSFAFEN